MSEPSHNELIREYRLQHGDLVMMLCFFLAPGVLFTPSRFRTWQFRLADLFTVVLFFAIMCAVTPWIMEMDLWWVITPSLFVLPSTIAGLFGLYVAQERAWPLITSQWAFIWGFLVPGLVRYFSGA